MDMRNGRIFSAEELAKFKECMAPKEWEKEKSHYLEMEKPPTPRQLSQQPPAVCDRCVLIPSLRAGAHTVRPTLRAT